MLGYDSLSNMFKTNFMMMQEHNYRLSEIENMIPWERFVYIDMLRQHIKNKSEESA